MAGTWRYRRNAAGKTLHRASCRNATGAVPWNWADGKSPDEMREDIAGFPGIRPCRVCKPTTTTKKDAP